MPTQTEVLRSPVSPSSYNANSQPPTTPAYVSQTRRYSQEVGSNYLLMKTNSLTMAKVQQTPSRPADPMSLSSIMSGPEPAIKEDSPVKVAAPSVKQEMPPSLPPAPIPDQAPVNAIVNVTPAVNGSSHPKTPVKSLISRHTVAIDENEVQTELSKIDAMDHSDVEGPGFEAEKKEYVRRGMKRHADLAAAEFEKRKVGSALCIQTLYDDILTQLLATTNRIS